MSIEAQITHRSESKLPLSLIFKAADPTTLLAKPADGLTFFKTHMSSVYCIVIMDGSVLSKLFGLQIFLQVCCIHFNVGRQICWQL